MAESAPFKNSVDTALAQRLAARIASVHQAFPTKAFVHDYTEKFETLELKKRVALLAELLRRYLPPSYPQALDILLALLRPEQGVEPIGMFGGWPLAHFVEEYGVEHPDRSLPALYEITQQFSAEFAIRPYLVRHPELTLARLHEWAVDDNVHVRRLVSEGTRPRLPWGKRLDAFVRDPEPVLALLERLKDDPSEYVRKSVANNLNDIAKDHPDRVVTVLETWLQNGTNTTRWIARHALRTLIKQGHPAALALLGYEADHTVKLVAFMVQPATLQMGSALRLAATLENESAAALDLVIDFRIHFVKANGKTSPKVFKWTTRTLAPGAQVTVEKSHLIKPITTRAYYAGKHVVEVQVNGKVLGSAAFDLEIPNARQQG